MINLLNNFLKFLDFKKKEKNFNRIIFNENINTIKYLDYIIKLDKPGTCVVSLEDLKCDNTNSLKYYHFNSFFISLLFIFLKTKFLYSSTPDLNFTIFRKSIYKRTKYIYVQHSPVSLGMAYNEKAFINFDAVQVVNKNQYSDLLDINTFHKKKIRPIKSKYRFLENFIKIKNISNKKINYLIAPTWNTDFYKLNLHKKLFKILNECNKTFIFRPHYMSIKKKEFSYNDLDLDKNKIDYNPELNFENYENLITDWSGIYLEFAIMKKIKPILINSKMKIKNNNYKKFTHTPIELEMRKNFSFEFDPDNLIQLKDFFINDQKITHKKFINSKILNDKFY